jgi:hypothetical protein
VTGVPSLGLPNSLQVTNNATTRRQVHSRHWERPQANHGKLRALTRLHLAGQHRAGPSGRIIRPLDISLSSNSAFQSRNCGFGLLESASLCTFIYTVTNMTIATQRFGKHRLKAGIVEPEPTAR